MEIGEEHVYDLELVSRRNEQTRGARASEQPTLSVSHRLHCANAGGTYRHHPAAITATATHRGHRLLSYLVPFFFRRNRVPEIVAQRQKSGRPHVQGQRATADSPVAKLCEHSASEVKARRRCRDRALPVGVNSLIPFLVIGYRWALYIRRQRYVAVGLDDSGSVAVSKINDTAAGLHRPHHADAPSVLEQQLLPFT